MSYDNETVEIEIVNKVRETDQAVLFNIEGDEFWIPKSVIDDMDECMVVVQKWFAKKEGFIE